MTCVILGCPAPVRAGELCNRHYHQVTRHPAGTVRSAFDRFYARVNITLDCDLWVGALTGEGYGSFYYDGRSVLAHRWAYEFWKGPIPAGLHLDHLCGNRACVNVVHLEAVTQAENNRRAVASRMAVAG